MTKYYSFSFWLVFLTSTLGTSKHTHDWRWNPRGTAPEFSTIRVFLFNVTNSADTISGEEPILREIGPYVYREKRVRFNISSTTMNTIKYQENKTYEFIPELSRGSEDDQFNFVNIPFISALTSLLHVPFVGPGMVDKLLRTNEKFVRQNVNVGDFLYNGIDVQLYTNILDTLGQSIPPQMAGGKFGIFKGKNGTDEGIIEVQETADYLHNVGELVTWNNQTHFNVWNQKQCNRLQGSTGEVFSPGIETTTILQYFNPEMCRSFPLIYQRNEEFKGIPAYRFIFPDDMFELATVNERNTCYCKSYDPTDFEPDFSSCLKKGALDLTLCRKAPLATSLPHFLHADPSYIEMVQGLNPNRDAHESFVVVEPKTGTVLNSSIRFQLNVQTSGLTRIAALKQIPRYLFPVMWGDKSFTMDDDTLDELRQFSRSGQQISPHTIAPVNSDQTLSPAFIALPMHWFSATILSSLVAYSFF